MCSEALGVIGTLSGTILGWALNSLSNKGKLKIYDIVWTDRFTNQNKYGKLVPSKCLEHTKHYSFNVSLDIYNSRSDIKIMRDIEIIF